jgi:hypothetical protein
VNTANEADAGSAGREVAMETKDKQKQLRLMHVSEAVREERALPRLATPWSNAPSDNEYEYDTQSGPGLFLVPPKKTKKIVWH